MNYGKEVYNRELVEKFLQDVKMCLELVAATA